MSRKQRRPRLRIRTIEARALKALPSWLGQEQAELYAAWTERQRSGELRRRLLAGDRANHPDVPRLLARKSTEVLLSDPHRAVDLAQAAVEAASCLKMPDEARTLLMDVQAEALGHLANSLRVVGKPAEAESIWEKVDLCRGAGTSDAKLDAELDLLRGTLWTDQRRFEQAIPLLRRASQDALEADESRLANRLRTQLATALGRSGASEAALEVSGKALADLNEEQDPELAFSLLHNSFIFLEASGQEAEALAGLKVAKNIYQVFATPEIWVRYHWMRGRLSNAVGEWRAAIEDLEVAKKGFLSRGLEYDACFVSLELALAYAQLRDLRKVRRLGEEMLPVFEALRLPNEAAAVLLTFGEAVENLRVSAAEINDWAAKLRPLRVAYERGESWAAPAVAG